MNVMSWQRWQPDEWATQRHINTCFTLIFMNELVWRKMMIKRAQPITFSRLASEQTWWPAEWECAQTELITWRTLHTHTIYLRGIVADNFLYLLGHDRRVPEVKILQSREKKRVDKENEVGYQASGKMPRGKCNHSSESFLHFYHSWLQHTEASH